MFPVQKKQAKMALRLPMRAVRIKKPFKVAPGKDLPSAFLRHDAPMTPPFFLKATPEKTLPGS